MHQTIVTLIISSIVVLGAILLLGISWLITGKSSVRAGMCGRAPLQKKGKGSGCGSEYSCGICGKSENKETDE
jgi:hypothetical protein